MHRTREDVATLFFKDHHPPPDADDPASMVASARQVLREEFMAADVGISSANFLVADTGATCTVTNEGNAELSTTPPRIHIVTAGIEKDRALDRSRHGVAAGAGAVRDGREVTQRLHHLPLRPQTPRRR